MKTPLIAVSDLTKTYPSPDGTVYALGGINFTVAAGESVGLVGASGSGKSTAAKCLIHLEKPTSGQIFFQGRDVTKLSKRQFRPFRRHIQMVHQDLSTALDPRRSVRYLLSEPLKTYDVVKKYDIEEEVERLIDLVHLEREFLDRRPGELSGGQRQRVSIARAIASKPDLVVLDEPTSSLDLPIRVEIIALLQNLQKELGLAYLFISHDLTTVRNICSRVLVMYAGRIVEEGPVDEIFANPHHEYTRSLFAPVPITDPSRLRDREGNPEPEFPPIPHDQKMQMVIVGPNGHRVAKPI
jgi:ABC-type oligopeptide transport system ATPase subunit